MFKVERRQEKLKIMSHFIENTFKWPRDIFSDWTDREKVWPWVLLQMGGSRAGSCPTGVCEA